MVNKVFIIGNLTRDPDVKVVNSNGKSTTVANFTVATSRYYTKANGEKDSKTTFIPCEAWDSGAVTIGKYLTKGSRLHVEGALQLDQWEKDDQKHSRLKVRVVQFTMLGGGPKKDGDEPASSGETAETQDTPDEPAADPDKPAPF